MQCSDFVYSDEYSDYIIPYFGMLEPLTIPENACFQDIGGGFGVMFRPGEFNVKEYGYQSIPKCYGLLDTSNLEATGVGQVRRQPYLGYRGNGVLVGILDTGERVIILSSGQKLSKYLGFWLLLPCKKCKTHRFFDTRVFTERGE